MTCTQQRSENIWLLRTALMSFLHHKQWYNLAKMEVVKAKAGLSTWKPTLVVYHGTVKRSK
jgi:hypothetical protein